MAGKRVFAQNLIRKGGQAVEALPHIRDPGGQPNLRMGGQRDHDEARPLARCSTASISKRPPTLSLCPEASYLNLTGTVGRLLGRRQSIRLDLNWQECRHFPARTEPWIAAQHKHHVGVKTMATGNR